MENLKRKIVSVAFIGRYKSGKSTLINAVLGRRWVSYFGSKVSVSPATVKLNPLNRN